LLESLELQGLLESLEWLESPEEPVLPNYKSGKNCVKIIRY
jgi:hypothetical protein